ncbi:Sterol regulatory element-binding protein [Lachnellula occidentalis]|uniref:Sterol regulatory element-binding protein n=1 Tax=Lachnellula occidentalis TaxID=215460 RepID=A0A8H8RL61_9HELO|nr:Sterol regulatory element-binding protein [Lachnellula occidentalis]
MASTCQHPGVDYFSLNNKQRSQSCASISPEFVWDSNPYNDPALVSSDSCDSILTSPTSPESITFPTDSFALSKEDIKNQSFNFGSFEDWMRWDDPSDAALSPTSDFFPELKLEPMSPNMGGLERQGGGASDDSAVFVEDPIAEEPLFQTQGSGKSSTLTDIPQRESLYSTPLSWSHPAPGSRSQLTPHNGVLTPQQEAKLRDIAMPSQARSRTSSSASSPEPCCTDNMRKRKSSADDEEDDEDDDECPPTSSGRRHPPIKKTAHNMIEKRYRTNLNDKITALRDSVPSLRVMSKRNSRGEEIEEDLQGLTPAHKLNKATVLSKATEYIAHLEKRNRYLTKENSSLKARVDAFEILVMARQPQMQQQQQQNQQQNQNQNQSRQGRYSLDGIMG